MAYNVQTLLNDLASVIHGTTTNKVPNIYGHISRAARDVLLDVDPKETQRIVELPKVFNSVYDYPAPADLKGDRIIDIRPTAGRTPDEQFNQGYGADFDAWKDYSWKNAIYTQWNTGIKTLRIEADFLPSPVTLTDTSSTTGWSVSGGVNTLTLDTVNNPAGGGALTFNFDGGQTSGYLENASLTAMDLTSYLNTSSGFLWVYLPTASGVSAIDIRWGSDSSNYYHLSVSTTQQGTAFTDGWNLIALPWTSASNVGSPVITSMKYVRASFTYSGALTGVKICNLIFAQGTVMNAVYYSKYLFRDSSTNVFQESVSSSSDNGKLINLDTESYNLLFNKAAFYIAQALQGADADYDATIWSDAYTSALTRYRALNPSEALVKATQYYRPGNKSYRNYSGRQWPN